MPQTSPRLVHNSQRQDPMLTRLCIGILGLFPMVTATLMSVVCSLQIAVIIAGAGAVTFMSLLPRGEGRRS